VQLNIGAPDLETLNGEVLALNIGRRAPRLRLRGAFDYEGRHVWSSDRAALSGQITFRQATVANEGWVVEDLDGTLPLAFHLGLWPGEWPREQRGTLTVGSIQRPPLRVGQRPLAIVAKPNVLALNNELPIQAPGGQMTVTGLQLQHLLAPNPSFTFGLRVDGINLGQWARSQGFGIVGLEGTPLLPPAVLSGQLGPCTLAREGGPLGSWTLSTAGQLSAPLFQGTLRLGGFRGRELASPTPEWGCWLHADHVSFGLLTGYNKQYGRLKVDANVKFEEFTVRGAGLEDVQSFRFEAQSIDNPKKEYFFDGRLALFLSRPTVEQALRENRMAEQDIVNKRFLFERVGAAFELKAGKLRGPLPLQGTSIISGMHLEGIEALAFRNRSVEGSPNQALSWAECIAKIRSQETLVRKFPVPQEAGDE
jgi:hypothetical protein